MTDEPNQFSMSDPIATEAIADELTQNGARALDTSDCAIVADQRFPVTKPQWS